MLKKYRQINYDKLHKGFVMACMAVTLYGLAIAGHRTYLYLTVTKPKREAEELKGLNKKDLINGRETLKG